MLCKTVSFSLGYRGRLGYSDSWFRRLKVGRIKLNLCAVLHLWFKFVWYLLRKSMQHHFIFLWY